MSGSLIHSKITCDIQYTEMHQFIFQKIAVHVQFVVTVSEHEFRIMILNINMIHLAVIKAFYLDYLQLSAREQHPFSRD
jgi:hypothetical protein